MAWWIEREGPDGSVVWLVRRPGKGMLGGMRALPDDGWSARGDGIGGPNSEYALALADALDGAAHIHAIACDTDGVDGAAEVAGALIGPETLSTARAAGIDPKAALAANDAHSFFAGNGGQVVTGPTLTNVNDFRAILIAPSS